jgi:hypothetical protein
LVLVVVEIMDLIMDLREEQQHLPSQLLWLHLVEDMDILDLHQDMLAVQGEVHLTHHHQTVQQVLLSQAQ